MSKLYPYTRDRRKSYQVPTSRGFQSISETNATTIYFSREENEPHPFHVKLFWEPSVQLSVALETFQEEVKLALASIEFDKPKDKYIYGRAPSSQRVPAQQKKDLIKVNTTVLMSRQDKLNEGQVLLDDLNNYRPIDKPMVETIDKTTAKWLSLTRKIIIKPME